MTHPDDEHEPGQPAPEYDELDEPRPPGRGRRIATGLAVVAVIVGFIGLVTWAIGIGPFGWRLFRYGNLTLYVYNGTPHFAHVSIDGVDYEIKPYSGRTLNMTGGELEIETVLQLVETDLAARQSRITDTREPLEKLSFTGTSESPWLYHVALPESTCLAVTDLKPFYDGSREDPRILDTVFKDARLRPLPYHNVIFPQEAMPDKISDELIWLAVVNCSLLREAPHLAQQKIMADAIAARRDLEKRRKEALRERGVQVD